MNSAMHPTETAACPVKTNRSDASAIKRWRRKLASVTAVVAVIIAADLTTLAAKSSTPNWHIGPRNLNYGTSKDAIPAPNRHFSIKNTGSADLIGSVGAIEGTDASAFSITSGAGPFTLSPKSSITVVVRFQAQHNGVSKAFIPLSSNANHPNANIMLTAHHKGITPTPTPTATPTPVVSTTSSGIGVIASNTGATAYVARGSYEAGSETGIDVVPLEPNHASPTAVTNSLIGTTTPAIACSGNSITSEVVCVGANNEVFLINGSTLTKTLTSSGQGLANFSGGSCTSCGVTVDPATNSAVIGLNLSPMLPVGGYQVLDLASNTFGPTIPNGEEQPSESPALDTVHHLVLSPGPSQPAGLPAFAPDYALLMMSPDITSSAAATAYAYADAATVFGGAADLDAAGADITTGIVVASDEEESSLFLANMNSAAFSSGAPFTWTAPAQLQSIPEFSSFLSSGLAAIAVAPVHHLVLAEDEFGDGNFGVIQLPTTIASGDTPAATDWVVATLPNPPGSGITWAMAGDPHGIGAYDSTSLGKAVGLLVNDQRNYLALVDMGALLAAPRDGAHTISPTVDLVASGIVTFIALP